MLIAETEAARTLKHSSVAVDAFATVQVFRLVSEAAEKRPTIKAKIKIRYNRTLISLLSCTVT